MLGRAQRRRRWVSYLLLCAGGLLLSSAAAYPRVILPTLTRFPDELHEKSELVGRVEARFLDTAPLGTHWETYNISVVASLDTVGTERGGEVVLLRISPEVENLDSCEPLPEVLSSTVFDEVYAVDRDTFENVPEYGNAKRTGLFTFPVGVEKRDYVLWNKGINDTAKAVYTGTSEVQGLETYVYEVHPGDPPLGYHMASKDSPADGLEVYYDGLTRYYVEPNTGVPVDSYTDATVTFLFKDRGKLCKLPAEFKVGLEILARLDAANETKLAQIQEDPVRLARFLQGEIPPSEYMDHIDMRVEAGGEAIGTLDGGEVARVRTFATCYDLHTGEILPDTYQYDDVVYAIRRSTYTLPGGEGYNPQVPKGVEPQFILPVGAVEAGKDYRVWANGVGQWLWAHFDGVTTNEGAGCYQFTMRGTDLLVREDSIPFFELGPVSKGLKAELRADITARYWVDPRTGISFNSSMSLDLYMIAKRDSGAASNPIPLAFLDTQVPPWQARSSLVNLSVLGDILDEVSNERGFKVARVVLYPTKGQVTINVAKVRALSRALVVARTYVPTSLGGVGCALIATEAVRFYLRRRPRGVHPC